MPDALVAGAIVAQTTALTAALVTHAASATTATGLVSSAIVAQTTAFTTAEAARVAKEVATNATAIAQATALGAQLITYYNEADDAIDDRDDIIDSQTAFMQQLEDLRDTQDLPMLECKKDIITDLIEPSLDMCWESIQLLDGTHSDGEGVDEKSVMLSQESCGGIPGGWSIHDGELTASKVGGYNGGILANSKKRSIERFSGNKTKLMRSAQIGVKSVYNSGDTLNQYAQASAIHSGIADMYIQGFNSAGAALGVIFGRMSGGGQ